MDASGASVSANIRGVAGVDEIDITARGLSAGQDFTIFAQGDDLSVPIRTVTAGQNGVVGEALAYINFFDAYDSLVLVPAGKTP